MKRILSSTTALSLVFANVQPWPLMAQVLTDDGKVVAADGSVLCEPTAEIACNPDDYAEQAAAIAAAMAEAEAAAAAAAEAEAAAAAEAEAAAAVEAEAAAAAEAEAAAAVEAEAAAAAEAEAAAAAEAEAAAAAAAEAEAAKVAEPAVEPVAEETAPEAGAEGEAATGEAPAEVTPSPEEAPEAEAVVTETPAENPPAEEEPAAEAATESEPASGEAAAEPTAAPEQSAPESTAEGEPDTTGEAEPATEAAGGETVPEAAAEGEPATETPVLPEKTDDERAAEEAARAAAEAELAIQPDGTLVDPVAGLKTEEVVVDPDAVPVEAPVVTETEVETLSEILAAPQGVSEAAVGTAAGLVEAPGEAERTNMTEAPPDPDAVSTVVQVLTEADARSSDKEFAPPPVQVSEGKKDRLSDLEKVGLVALGALVVGVIINESKKEERRQVVSNTGDRVIVLKPDGTYQVYKDDDAVLRRPGSTVRTETYKDGSTRTIVERPDGTQVVTIRDASGRVLRRAQYDRLGRELVLFNDLEEEERVIIEDLPKPKKKRVTISTKDEDAALKAKLAAKEAKKAGRKFSLRQVREIPEVRALAATIEVDSVTFDSGSAAIKASEADALADLGSLMQELLDANPAEVFLIEGHTDAVGKAALNLALSDRRAESVALALTEYFDIPPENMIVQGYGESELLIDTLTDERKNRRVVVRLITPLLKISE